MKTLLPIVALVFVSSCSSHMKSPDKVANVDHVERSVAGAPGPLREFLEAALEASIKSSKKLAKNSADEVVFKSAKEMEEKLIKLIKEDPKEFGISDETAKAMKSIDEIKGEAAFKRVAESATSLFKFGKEAKEAGMQVIEKYAGVAKKLETVGTIEIKTFSLSAKEDPGLGRDLGLKIKNIEPALENKVERGMAKQIREYALAAAFELKKIAKTPQEIEFAKKFLDSALNISAYTKQPFLGPSSCKHVTGLEVFKNRAEIAEKVYADLLNSGKKDFDAEDVSKALVEGHATVTKRTREQACKAVQALTVVPPCSGQYHKSLAPIDC